MENNELLDLSSSTSHPISRQELKEALWPFLIDLLETIVLAVILFSGANAFTTRVQIESVSMQPTLYAGELVLVNKLAYQVGEPRRGDVIIFDQPSDPEKPYIKRIIGLPGDEVRIEQGGVQVNGEALREPYLLSAPRYAGVWHVPEGSFFVLGDNRNNSSDSHIWGMVSRDKILGKAEVVYWPVDDWKVLSVRAAAAAEP